MMCADTLGTSASHQPLCQCGQPDHGTNACQAWFWSDEWQQAEREVDADLDAGRFETFDNMQDFMVKLT